MPDTWLDKGSIRMRSIEPLKPRPCIQALLGCRVASVCPPYPSMTDTTLHVYGALMRLLAGRKRPKSYRHYREFCRMFVRNWIVPCESDTFPDDFRARVEWWLALTHYTEDQKRALREVMEDYLSGRLKLEEVFKLKSHIKPEFYMAGLKPSRCINARVALAKIIFGPFIKAIEMRVYQLPFFIKKIPVADRVKYMTEHIVRPGCKYIIGDYTAYESSFNGDMMEAGEMQVISWVGQNLPHFRWFFRLFKKVTKGMNKCKFRKFIVEISATRMSGEMSTSLCNGIQNLLTIQYVGSLHGYSYVPCVIEGDDSAQAVPLDSTIAAKDYEDLGYKIKLDTYSNPFEGGFCGMSMDPISGVNCPDPSMFVQKIFYSGEAGAMAGRDVQRMLLGAKALSAGVNYSAAPVVGAVVRYCLRIAEPKGLETFVSQGTAYWDQWDRDNILANIKKATADVITRPVDLNARAFVERKYALPVSMQMKIESYFDGLNEPCEFSIASWLNLPADHYKMESTVRKIPAGFPVDQIHLLSNEVPYDPREVFPQAPWVSE